MWISGSCRGWSSGDGIATDRVVTCGSKRYGNGITIGVEGINGDNILPRALVDVLKTERNRFNLVRKAGPTDSRKVQLSRPSDAGAV